MLRLLLLAGCLCLFAAPALAQTADPDPVALAAIKKMGLGANLANMSQRMAAEAPGYKRLLDAVGETQARAMIREEVGRNVQKYQDRWDRNLAASYTEFMTPRELQSLADTGPSSPFFGKFQEKQADVAKSMEAKSIGLLRDLTWESLNAAMRRAGVR